LKAGNIYVKANGNFVAVMDIGTEKGRKFLTMEGGLESIKKNVLDSIQGLNSPSVIPNWHWCGSLKVLKKIGQVVLPKGLGKRFDDHVKDVTESAARWNDMTSR
jgi:hypothetical protein